MFSQLQALENPQAAPLGDLFPCVEVGHGGGQSCRGVLVQVQGPCHKCGSQTFGWVLVKAKFPFSLSAG